MIVIFSDFLFWIFSHSWWFIVPSYMDGNRLMWAAREVTIDELDFRKEVWNWDTSVQWNDLLSQDFFGRCCLVESQNLTNTYNIICVFTCWEYINWVSFVQLCGSAPDSILSIYHITYLTYLMFFLRVITCNSHLGLPIPTNRSSYMSFASHLRKCKVWYCIAC